MDLPLDLDTDATQRQLQKENKQQKDSGGSEGTLMWWLKSSELDVDNFLSILQVLEDNKDDLKQTLNCCRAVIKFANYSVKVKRSEEWLKATEQVLLNIDKNISSLDLAKEEIPFTDLYIAKFSCLKACKNSDEEAKECLRKAISLSSRCEEKIKAYLTVAQYYEDISEYNEMKKYLDKSEKLCQTKPILENYLGHVWLLLGHYYFFQFNFRLSLQNLRKARTKLQSILNKTQNKTKESEWTYRRLSDCLHYIGRIYHEHYELVKAAEYYIEAQRILEENQKNYFLAKEPGATAFYHLRLGQILEICQIRDGAREHYNESEKIFSEYGVSQKDSKSDNSEIVSSGSAQVYLAQANMIKDAPSSQSKSYEPTLKKQEAQIKKAEEDSLKTGYYRGYLLALLQLFWLYVRNLKLHLALPLVWKALTSDEFKKSGGVLLIYRYAKKFIFGIFYKIRFLVWLKLHSDKVLYRCPCPIHQHKQDEK